MLTGALRNRIDALWTEFWTGGIANPLTVVEQITFLMFARLLDMAETLNERKSSVSGKEYPRLFTDDQKYLRWSQFYNKGAAEMLPLIRDKVFPTSKPW